jgi:hypothetical protein
MMLWGLYKSFFKSNPSSVRYSICPQSFYHFSQRINSQSKTAASTSTPSPYQLKMASIQDQVEVRIRFISELHDTNDNFRARLPTTRSWSSRNHIARFARLPSAFSMSLRRKRSILIWVTVSWSESFLFDYQQGYWSDGWSQTGHRNRWVGDPGLPCDEARGSKNRS